MGGEDSLSKIAGVVAEPTIVSMRDVALATPAGLVELRLDALEGGIRGHIVDIGGLIEELKRQGKRVIVTIRSFREGGLFEGPQREKEEAVIDLAGYRPDFIDWELRDPATGTIAKTLAGTGVGLILSLHEFEKPLTTGEINNVSNRARRLARDTGISDVIVKIVYRCREPLEGIPSLAAVARGRGSLISFGLGGACRYTRLLTPFVGAPFTYAYASRGPVAPGQYSVEEVLREWRRMGLA